MAADRRTMSPRAYSSRPHESILPRPHRDESHRLRTYGKVEPMRYDEDPAPRSARFAYTVGAIAILFALYHVARHFEVISPGFGQ